MKKLALLLFIITPLFCYADSIHFGVYTAHLKQSDTWNNNNNLLALEVDNYIVASFTNSYGFPTYLAGYEVRLTKHLSVIPSVSYGYDARCFSFIRGRCAIETFTPHVLPLFAVKASQQFGPITLSVIGADYVNVSIGVQF